MHRVCWHIKGRVTWQQKCYVNDSDVTFTRKTQAWICVCWFQLIKHCLAQTHIYMYHIAHNSSRQAWCFCLQCSDCSNVSVLAESHHSSQHAVTSAFSVTSRQSSACIHDNVQFDVTTASSLKSWYRSLWRHDSVQRATASVIQYDVTRVSNLKLWQCSLRSPDIV